MCISLWTVASFPKCPTFPMCSSFSLKFYNVSNFFNFLLKSPLFSCVNDGLFNIFSKNSITACVSDGIHLKHFAKKSINFMCLLMDLLCIFGDGFFTCMCQWWTFWRLPQKLTCISNKVSKVQPQTKTMLFDPKCVIVEHTSMCKKLEFPRKIIDLSEIFRFS